MDMISKKEKVPWRHEIKYVCSEAQIPDIQNKVSAFCYLDGHVDADGRYYVRSVYFDDYNDTAYYENEMGVDRRRKYRIRMYNGDAEHLVLERKSKFREKTYKESIPLSKEQCEMMLSGDWMCADIGKQTLLLQQFYLEYRTKMLRPKVIVEYERIPYIYATGNVRVTFDKNIAVTGDAGSFLEQSIITRPIMPEGQHVLEVKYDTLIPDFIYNAISGERLRQTSYSKYYLCRKIDEGR